MTTDTLKLTAEEIIKTLNLQPHPQEGGYFRETYRSVERLSKSALPDRYAQDRCISTAIYYLLTPDTFSCMHRLKSDEIFHFYTGDPVEMLWLCEDGISKILRLGQNLKDGEYLQMVVPAGTWQGSRLKEESIKMGFALLGCTVSPGFEYDDYETGSRDYLVERYKDQASLIHKLTFTEV